MVTKAPSLHPSPTVNTGRSVGNGAAPLQGSLIPYPGIPGGRGYWRKFIFLVWSSLCPWLGVRSGHWYDRRTGTERQACGSELRFVVSPGGPGAGTSPSSDDPAARVGKSQGRRCQPAWPGSWALRTRPTALPAGLRPAPPPVYTTASWKGFLTLAGGSFWCHRPGQ